MYVVTWKCHERELESHSARVYACWSRQTGDKQAWKHRRALAMPSLPLCLGRQQAVPTWPIHPPFALSAETAPPRLFPPTTGLFLPLAFAPRVGTCRVLLGALALVVPIARRLCRPGILPTGVASFILVVSPLVRGAHHVTTRQRHVVTRRRLGLSVVRPSLCVLDQSVTVP